MHDGMGGGVAQGGGQSGRARHCEMICDVKGGKRTEPNEHGCSQESHVLISTQSKGAITCRKRKSL